MPKRFLKDLKQGQDKSYMEKITRKEIVQILHERTGLSKRFLLNFIESLLEEMKKAFDLGEEVKISNFGTFIPQLTKPRLGRNPKTGEVVPIKPFKKVVLHLSPTLRNLLHHEKER